MGSPLDTGVVIGDFRIEGRAGVGGMGVVYRARQLSLDRAVALKVLGGALADPVAVARFRRAATAAARLSHPNIAAVHFVGQDAAVCYLAMEYVDGRSLQEVIRALAAGEADSPDAAVTAAPPATVAQRFDAPDSPTTDLPADRPPVPPLAPGAARLIADPAYQRRCVQLVRDAARALHHAHEQGVVHRDVKPGNLMLARDGAVKVIDFGVARFYEDQTLTATGSLVGTPLYMSPEQVTGRVELTAATDVYSLGLVLIELLTLRPPIAATNREELLRRIVIKSLPPLRRANPAVPVDLQAVAHKAAAKDADERYATAQAFADDLQRWLDGKPIAAAPYRGACDGVRAEITAGRPPSVSAAGIGLVMGAVASAGFAFTLVTLLSNWGSRSAPRWPVESAVGVFLAAGAIHAVAAWHLLTGTRLAVSAVTTAGLAVAAQLGAIAVMLLNTGSSSPAELRVLAGVYAALGLALGGWAARWARRPRVRSWLAFAARVRAEAAGIMPAGGQP